MKYWDSIRTDYGSQLFNAVRDNNSKGAEKALAKMGDKVDEIIKESAYDQLKNGADDNEVVEVLAAYTSMGESKAEDWVQKAHMKVDTGISYDGMDEAWKAGKITTEEAIEYKQEYGGVTKEQAEKTVQGWVNNKDSEKKYGVPYSKMAEAYADRELNRSDYINAIMEYDGKTRGEATAKVNKVDFKEKYDVDYSKANLKRLYEAGKLTDKSYIDWYMKCEDSNRESAQYDLDTTKTEIRFGHDSSWTYQSDYNTVYSNKNDKLGIDELYDQYGRYFKNEKSLGKVFNDYDDISKNGKAGHYTYDYKGKTQTVSAAQAAKIDALNKNIKSGNISYEAAKIIWEHKWGYSTYASGPWQFVHK